MKILIVPEKFNNKKLIAYLQYEFDGLSNSLIYKTLRKKDIKLNDKRISENCLLKTGDELKIYIADSLLDSKHDIPIIYEDDNIIVFDKPSGMEVTGDNSLTSYAKEHFGDNLEPCHRLDRNTTGLTLFSKNAISLKILLSAFKEHNIEKRYIALVYGIPKVPHKRLEAYLFKDSKKSLVYISDEKKPKYQKIITSYTLIKKDIERNISLLDISIETGRTHQIRAHLAHIGLPIVGDGKYGLNKINQEFKQKNQLLSSYSLTFHIGTDSILGYLDNQTISKKELPFDKLI